jgi:hypothetical protein
MNISVRLTDGTTDEFHDEEQKRWPHADYVVRTVHSYSIADDDTLVITRRFWDELSKKWSKEVRAGYYRAHTWVTVREI